MNDTKKGCPFSISIKKWNTISELFKALGAPHRLGLIMHLCSCSRQGTKELNVNEFKTCCDVDLSVISRHLAVLREANVLNANKKGKEVLYSLNGKELAKTLRELADFLESHS